jgi:hypothetical protein
MTADPDPIYDALLTEGLAILREWLTVARAVVADVASVEVTNPNRAKRDKAVGRWQIYLGIMMIKMGEGIASLAPTDNFRPMIILARSLYEYLTKARFFLTHRKEAYEQYLSTGARMYADLSKVGHPNPMMAVELGAAYLNWKRTSGTRNEYSGNVSLSKMHLSIVHRDEIKSDKDGSQYTEQFQTGYGFPSLYVHGEPLLIPEVFKDANDDSDWSYREDTTYMDCLLMVGLAGSYMNRWCAAVSKAYGFDFSRLRKLKERNDQQIANEGRFRGF